MMKLKNKKPMMITDFIRKATSLLVLLPLALGLSAQEVSKEDVTTTYIKNPSFETDRESDATKVTQSADGLRGWTLANPSGWTVSGTDVTKLLVTKDCYTDNNFGLVTTLTDGSHAYYLRMGWSTGSTTLSQTLSGMPAGQYMLTADVRTAYANSASSSFTLKAGGKEVSETFEQGSNGIFASMAWKTVSAVVTTTDASDLTIGLTVDWLSGGSCIMVDNVRLYKVTGEIPEPQDPTEKDVDSPTEGVITHDFVAEAQMKDDLLQMLADFSTYMKNDFQECASPNSVNEACGCFRGENTMGNNEQGVRPNADLSMICAFLVKYGQGKVTLPAGVTWKNLEDMAMKSLVFAYSTHKANKLKVCAGNNYWGSVSNADHVWESSLWAMSVAYSAFFQWEKLSANQKDYIYKLLKAECNYELERSIPTGYNGDTKAEENGWEADILAATLGLFPNDPLASRWFDRLRAFAINSYSHVSDATNTTVIDPDYDNKTVKDYYQGKNLYDDYTLQNHNLFHTSYQNVVMQELGEAALALKLFQLGVNGTEKWKTNALMHHNQEVMDKVLNWLALADGELAMPNGNDWSLFLYDQITSYTTQACFQRDTNALMLENLAYKYIKARQTTTADGSWLLNADVGARRMGVEGHRVMMTWLMHEALPTADLTPTRWDDFNKKYADAKILTSQNIVRAATDDRFTCFSWSTGLSSYTGYIASNSPDKNKIIVPYRANNTGNFLGWYTVSGKNTNATPVVSGIYNLQGNAYTMNGELNTNDGALNNRFVIYSTPGNAVAYLDYVRANAAATITKEQGGLMAISTDPLMKTARTLYTEEGYKQLDGKSFASFTTDWVNIDNELGIVSLGDKKMGFGDRSLNNSIYTSKIYPSYSAQSRSVKAGDVVDRRNIIYYSNISAEDTKALAGKVQDLKEKVPQGWNGLIMADPDQTQYLLLANFLSDRKCSLSDIVCEKGAPVFSVPTTIRKGKSSADFTAEVNHSVAEVLKVFVGGSKLTAVKDSTDADAAYLRNDSSKTVSVPVCIVSGGTVVEGTAEIPAGQTVKVGVKDGKFYVESGAFPSSGQDDLTAGYKDITSEHLQNPNFEEDTTYGDPTGNVTLGGVTYNPCYVNKVSAANASFPNILPVKGWTAGNGLSGASNYARMYSMPYSTTMFCVSPSNVGNYAAQCARPMADESAADRCLTVLNSWTSGKNAITQTVTLQPGTYRVLMDMKYECTNQTSNNGSTVVASGNTNTSLTGVKIGSKTDYRYPSERSSWQVMCYDFELAEPTAVTVSAGFSASASVGAANNTLLYIDNVRLLVKQMKGDVNEDGKVDINDVVAVINHMAGTANWRYANVNEDAENSVDINDVVAIINIMAGVL